MQDRFKFRVWRPKNIFVRGWQPKYIYFSLDMGEYAIGFAETDIVEQCTGLKDKNGKLIYDGDIVQMSYPYCPNNKYMVKWGDCCWELWLNNGFVYVVYEKMSQSMEVIGNIHENADLLGDKTDEPQS